MAAKQITLLNYRDVMDRLRCSAGSVTRLAQAHKISRKYYPGIGYRYDEQSVNQFIKEEGI